MKNVLAEALRLDKQLADTLDNGGMKKLAAKLYEDELPLYERALELLDELSSDPVKTLYDVSEVLSVRRPSLKPSNDEKPVYYGGYNAEAGAIRDYIKKSLIDPLKKAYLNVPAEDMLKDMAGTEDMLTALTDLTKEFDLIYAGAKRKAGVVDFNDIEPIGRKSLGFRICCRQDFSLANFEEEFVRWNPYHIECELLDGGWPVPPSSTANRAAWYAPSLV